MLRREHHCAAVVRRTKLNAVLGDFGECEKRNHLKSAAISEQIAVPFHEFMKTADGLHHVATGPMAEVIGIAENDFAIQ
jgi:hypothetical protein